MRGVPLALLGLAIAVTAWACAEVPESVPPDFGTPPGGPIPIPTPTGCSLWIFPRQVDPTAQAYVAGERFTPGSEIEVTWIRDDGDRLVLRTADSPLLKADAAGTWRYLTRPLPTSIGHAFEVSATDGACTARSTWEVRAAAASPIAPIGTAPPCSARTSRDRPDELTGHQVHFMYALPADAEDEAWDEDGTIARSAALVNAWLAAHAGGRRFRVDTCGGVAEVTLVRLSGPDIDYFRAGDAMRDFIEADLAMLGYLAPSKIYAVYYGGRSNLCGGNAAWPPGNPGVVAVEYHLGSPGIPCHLDRPGGAITGVPEFVMVHELLHLLGYAPTCGKNNTGDGHVNDDRFDLMYQGHEELPVAHLDENHDDYFDHGIAGCPDLAHSTFIEPVPADAAPPPGWPGG
jgi:hypothetical protein